MHHHFPKIITCLALFLFFTAKSQVPVDSNAVHIIPVADTAEKTQEKDIIDVVRKWLRLKSSSKSDNIKPGDKPVITVLPAIGYTLQTRFAVIVAGNAAFFTSDQPRSKLSVVNANITYTQNNQFTIPVQLSVWLKGDQYNLLGDWRYMKYPQSTYGLGTDTKLGVEDPMDYKYIRVYQYVLKKVAENFSAGLGYTFDYHWNISEKGLPDGTVSDYAHYGAAEKTTSAGPALIAIYDNRTNPINPARGLYASLLFRDNLEWAGSNSNWQSAIADVRKYFQFPGHSKNVLAFWAYGWIVLKGRSPYLDLPSNGWDNFNNTGRGFIQGRFRGNTMLYLESEYRFRITHNGLIGGVVFVNAESFSDAPSHRPRSIQPGEGIGLRVKLNKKSNTNIAIDYGFGTEGMRGFFVNVGEVF
ncbi:MAG: hypothetical protein Q8941_11595 [Bacteroidota bacterium]|nr:hypothetical protein [Bacteroidota bacterium]